MILETEIERLGKTKLTVGVQKEGRLVQYCITAMELKNS